MTAAPPVVRLTRVWLDTPELRARLASDPRQAAEAIRDVAERGAPAAQLVFGQLLLDGHGVAADPAAALAWFERAAECGDAEGWNMVGRCHERGWGVAQDYDRAAACFAQAARRGHVWATVNLAQILMRLGDPADRPRAYRLFKEAAAAGNLKALNSLARFLEEGWVAPANPAGAAALYRTAAARGDHWAEFNLGVLLARADRIAEAAWWISRAIARSDGGFRGRIAPLLTAHPDATLRALGAHALDLCTPSGNRAPRPRVRAGADRLRGWRPARGKTRAIAVPAASPVGPCPASGASAPHSEPRRADAPAILPAQTAEAPR